MGQNRGKACNAQKRIDSGTLKPGRLCREQSCDSDTDYRFSSENDTDHRRYQGGSDIQHEGERSAKQRELLRNALVPPKGHA